MKRKINFLTAAAIFCLLLTGCGDGSGDMQAELLEPETVGATGSGKASEAEAEPEPTAEPEIKLLCSAGHTEEEDLQVRQAVEELYQNMELEEYLGEGIHMVSNESWYETMAADLVEGARTYLLQKGDEILFTVQVGVTISGERYSNAYYCKEDNMVLLKQEGSLVQVTMAQLKDNLYDGSFEQVTIDSETGAIRIEQGTCAQGLRVGEYSVMVKAGTGAGDPYDLWSMRENFSYETTVTEYDAQGNEIQPEPTPTPEPTATPKPTKKPTATPKPTPTPEPTPEPAPQPTPQPPVIQNPQPPASTPEPTPQPTPTPEPTPTPSSGPSSGDVDIEWSPDIE